MLLHAESFGAGVAGGWAAAPAGALAALGRARLLLPPAAAAAAIAFYRVAFTPPPRNLVDVLGARGKPAASGGWPSTARRNLAPVATTSRCHASPVSMMCPACRGCGLGRTPQGIHPPRRIAACTLP